MKYQLPDIRSTDFVNKRVFVLSDLDVPISPNGEIQDTTRLTEGEETRKLLLDNNCTLILAGKLGRPKGQIVSQLSLKPVADWLANQFKAQCVKCKVGEFDGWKITERLFVLENLRFNKGEEENDIEFAKKLSGLADYYVNDAFSLCHRAHASVVSVPAFLPHAAGIHLQKEVHNLEEIMLSPKRPMVVIIGGVKIETKLPLIKKMLEIADTVLVGGKLAVEAEKKRSTLNGNTDKLRIATLTPDGFDIDEKSIEEFSSYIGSAATIVWNGPMGFVEEGYDKGSVAIAQKITQSNAYKMVGGGDTVEYVQRIGLSKAFDFISTGGGAMLVFLSGEQLPGLEALA